MRSFVTPGLILWYCILPERFAVAEYMYSNRIGIGEGMYFIVNYFMHKHA